VLTSLQHQIRSIVAASQEPAIVALAGGGALIVTGIVQRGTQDLDFFTQYPQSVRPALEAIEPALLHAGLKVARLHESDTYARLKVTSQTESTFVDLASDYRLLPPRDTPDGAVLAEHDLAADKTLALYGRAAPRDFIDFEALTRRYSLEQICDLAVSKDNGFTPARLADALDSIAAYSAADYQLSVDAFRDLVAFSANAAEHLRTLAIDKGDSLSLQKFAHPHILMPHPITAPLPLMFIM
jgi:hypothetical protein